jgi:hypothetical protein
MHMWGNQGLVQKTWPYASWLDIFEDIDVGKVWNVWRRRTLSKNGCHKTRAQVASLDLLWH